MMSLPNQILKNRCERCQKILLLHNKIMQCKSCEKLVHSTCAKYNFQYDHITNSWQCWDCADTKNRRYNPFCNITFDKHDPSLLYESNDLTELSKYLTIANLTTKQNLEISWLTTLK